MVMPHPAGSALAAGPPRVRGSVWPGASTWSRSKGGEDQVAAAVFRQGEHGDVQLLGRRVLDLEQRQALVRSETTDRLHRRCARRGLRAVRSSPTTIRA